MKPRLVACPICGQPSPYDPANPYRPFCSKRCKLIDLGQWASESYAVPAGAVPAGAVPAGAVPAGETAEADKSATEPES